MPERKTDISQFSLLDKIRRGEVIKSDYSGKDEQGNKLIRLLAIEQGFDAKPNVIRASEMNGLEKTGDYFIAARGVTEQRFAEELKFGEMFFGLKGMFGDGIYSALKIDDGNNHFEIAQDYGDTLLEFAYPKSARIAVFDALFNKVKKAYLKAESDFKNGKIDVAEWEFSKQFYKPLKTFDYGVTQYALSKGFDAVLAEEKLKSESYLIILNRGILYVKA
jgi:hypothetical protein